MTKTVQIMLNLETRCHEWKAAFEGFVKIGMIELEYDNLKHIFVEKGSFQ